MPRAFVFDAYGTLFDVHAAIGRHRAAAGPDADRFSEIWRTKQLEYSWTLTLAGRYVDFWTLTERALDFAFARFPSVDQALRPKLLDAYWTLEPFSHARPDSCAGPAVSSHRGGRRGRDGRRTGCGALRGCGPHLQAPSRGLCARHRAFQRQGRGRGLCLVQPLGRGGGRELRAANRVDQSRERRGRIRAGTRCGSHEPQRAPDARVRRQVGEADVVLPEPALTERQEVQNDRG